MTHVMVVGTSEPQDFQLQDDGAHLDGTDWSVDVVFRESVGGNVTVTWLDQGAGTVRVTGTEGMALGTYHFRFRLTDADDRIGYIPNLDAEAGVWQVVKV